ncbi:hypothetical protein LPJ53_004004 [Coemansia erecta]|uniref:SMP-LTD domain-containing protein n=1 Tax=Coemansia erecta TaxID=147472 RepID=A0A9W7XV61_9FUNG|nr:hypothetical protein LPJ53_004004 [Coemansia erecta]
MHVTLGQLLLTYVLGVLTLPALVLGGLFVLWTLLPSDSDRDSSRSRNSEGSPRRNSDAPKEPPKPAEGRQPASPYGVRRAGWLRITRSLGSAPPALADQGTKIGDLVARGLAKWINGRGSGSGGGGSSNAAALEGAPDAMVAEGLDDLYYVVLTGDTLVMYDGEAMGECRGVIIMTKYRVSLHHRPGAGEAQVYSRKTPVRLAPLDDSVEARMYKRQVVEYYVYVDRPADKEDWYLALMWSSLAAVAAESSEEEGEGEGEQESGHVSAGRRARMQRRLRQSCMVPDRAGIQAIQHTVAARGPSAAPGAVRPDEWLNAVFGRMFLAAYRTEWARRHFMRKMQSKFDRVERPVFLERIVVAGLDIGDNVPVITEPQLAAFDASGLVDVSMFVHYKGGFRLALDTAVRLGGLRLTVSLEVVLQSLAGRMLVRFKPAPSNRFWMGFYDMPSIRLSVHPVFMQKQVRYAAVSQAIEKQIYDIVRTTLVLPNLDDTVFFPTTVAEGAVLETALKEYYDAGLDTDDAAAGEQQQRQRHHREEEEEDGEEQEAEGAVGEGGRGQPRARPFSMTDVELGQPAASASARKMVTPRPLAGDCSDSAGEDAPASEPHRSRHGHSHSRSTLGTTATSNSSDTTSSASAAAKAASVKSDLLTSAASLFRRAKDSQAAESAKTWWQSTVGTAAGAQKSDTMPPPLPPPRRSNFAAAHAATSASAPPLAVPLASPPPAAVGFGPRQGILPASPTSPAAVVMPRAQVFASDGDGSVASGFHFPRLADAGASAAGAGDALLTRRRPAALSQGSEVELPMQRRYSKPK